MLPSVAIQAWLNFYSYNRALFSKSDQFSPNLCPLHVPIVRGQTWAKWRIVQLHHSSLLLLNRRWLLQVLGRGFPPALLWHLQVTFSGLAASVHHFMEQDPSLYIFPLQSRNRDAFAPLLFACRSGKHIAPIRDSGFSKTPCGLWPQNCKDFWDSESKFPYGQQIQEPLKDALWRFVSCSGN